MIEYLNLFFSLISSFFVGSYWSYFFIPLICLGIIIISIKVVFLCLISLSR